MCNILKWFKPSCVDFTKPEKKVEVKINRAYIDDVQLDPKYFPVDRGPYDLYKAILEGGGPRTNMTYSYSSFVLSNTVR